MSGLQGSRTCCVCVLSLALAGCSDSNVPTPDAEGPIPHSDSNDSNRDDQGLGDGESLPPVVHPPVGDQLSGNTGPEGNSQLRVDSRSFPLNAALGDIWGVDASHYKVAFTLTNGQFLVQPTVVEGVEHSMLVPVNATAVMYAELHSPGKAMSFITYSHAMLAQGNQVLDGVAFFDQGYVGFDTNRSGEVEPEETFAVTGGTIEFSGVLPDIELRFHVTLENGLTADGFYTGLFDFADRTP